MSRTKVGLAVVATTAAVLVAAVLGGCDGEQVSPGPNGAGGVPAEFKKGGELYAEGCSICHGKEGVGTSKGPPLVHATYEPTHHDDNSFYNAVELGVGAHHWNFGPMPPQPSVARDDVTEIIRYVRWRQREAGIYEGTTTTLVTP